jgi:uncharacterized protein DUF3732
MQLLEVVIYSHDGRRRILPFVQGELNVVSGDSKSGKSALIDIVHYCLGSDGFRVPEGTIVDKVSWYGLRVQLDRTQAFMARPRPPGGRGTTSAMMLRLGRNLDLPSFTQLSTNTNAEAVVQQLGDLIGIHENQALVPDAATRVRIEANLDHALVFCFQRQGEIANQDLLFHRQAEPWVATHIRDTLPYFLGAVPADYVVQQDRLRRLRVDLRTQEARLERLEQALETAGEESRSLLIEAQEAGLIAAQDWTAIESPNLLSRSLAQALDAPPDPAALAIAADTGMEELLERQRAAAGEYRDLTRTHGLLSRLLSEQGEYVGVLERQVELMAPVELMGDVTNEACPVCGQDLGVQSTTVEDLREALESLRGSLGEAGPDEPRLRRMLVEVEQSEESVRLQLHEIESTLERLGQQRAEVEALRSAFNRQSYVRGRIDHFLATGGEASEQTMESLRSRIQTLKREIDAIVELIGYDAVRENVTSILNVVGEDMRTWALQLGLEYAENTVRIDLAQLTVVADRPTGRVPMTRMGSGMNWVGYHLVAYLALQKFFVDQGRPVPRFVMLDQPTQAFYAPDATDAERGILRDEDRLAVDRIFQLLRQVAAALAPSLQIIVMDHEHPDRPGLAQVVREEWRGGLKLVPEGWPGSTR